jgi:phosphotransferase system IIB component
MDAQEIVAGLGGADRIVATGPYAARLRATAVGVVRRGGARQVAVGPRAHVLAGGVADRRG